MYYNRQIKRFFIIFVFIFIFTNFGQAQVNRPYEPIILTGDSLDVFTNLDVNHLYLYAYHDLTTSWELIPFQIDEVNPDVEDEWDRYFIPEDTLAGYFDADDELVFLSSDMGDRAGLDKWVSNSDSTRLEIAVYDSLTYNSGYVYLFHLPDSNLYIPNYNLAYDDTLDQIVSDNYTIRFNASSEDGDDNLEIRTIVETPLIWKIVGIGLIAVVHEESAQEFLDRLIAMKENAFFIGEVVERKGGEERVQWV